MLVWHHGGMGGTMCPDDDPDDTAEGGMVSGGGLEYIVIRPPESTVVSRPESEGKSNLFLDICFQPDIESAVQYRVRKLNMTRKWINRLFGQAQAVWQFFLFPGHV